MQTENTASRDFGHWPEVAGAALGVTLALGAAAFAAFQLANGLPHVHVELPYGNPDNGSIAQPFLQFVGSAVRNLR